MIHGLINENFAGDSIHLVNAGAGVGVDGTVHQNGAAEGLHIVGNGGSPVQLGILGVDRRLVVHHAVILIVLTQMRPCGVEVDKRVIGRCLL